MKVVEINRQKCPYCKEETAIGAKKCKHCGEWLDTRESSKVMPRVVSNRNKSKWDILSDKIDDSGYANILSAVVFGVLGWLIFHFGSWNLIFGAKTWELRQYQLTGVLHNRFFILEDEVVAIGINNRFYGFANDAYFFDSPTLQFAMLCAALYAFYLVVKFLFFGD